MKALFTVILMYNCRTRTAVCGRLRECLQKHAQNSAWHTRTLYRRCTLSAHVCWNLVWTFASGIREGSSKSCGVHTHMHCVSTVCTYCAPPEITRTFFPACRPVPNLTMVSLTRHPHTAIHHTTHSTCTRATQDTTNKCHIISQAVYELTISWREASMSPSASCKVGTTENCGGCACQRTSRLHTGTCRSERGSASGCDMQHTTQQPPSNTLHMTIDVTARLKVNPDTYRRKGSGGPYLGRRHHMYLRKWTYAVWLRWVLLFWGPEFTVTHSERYMHVRLRVCSS